MKTIRRRIVFLSFFTFLAAIMVAAIQTMPNAKEIKNPPQLIMGTIQQASYSSIRVNGQDYDISNASVLTKHGTSVSKGELRQGMEVEMHVEGGRVISVIIRDRSHRM